MSVFPQQLAALLAHPLLAAAHALVLPLLLLSLVITAHATQNITLEDTASQITYSPPACGLTRSSAGADTCNSSWQIVAAPNASDGTITTTSGATDGGAGFIPQLFLSVRALSLSIRTSPNSTAFVNITVSTSNPVVSISARVNSSVQPLEIIGLTEDRITTLALTFDESPEPTVLDIDSIIVTFSDNNTTPFVSTSATLPATTTLATITPSIVIPSATSQASRRGQTKGDVAAEVLGSILGALFVGAGVAFVLLFFRKRKRRRAEQELPVQHPPEHEQGQEQERQPPMQQIPVPAVA